MTTAATPRLLGDSARSSASARPAPSLRYDWTMATLSSLLLAGVTIDIWAHNHGRTDETFFTPWHALLYGALLLTGIFLAASAVWNVMRGCSWRRSLPPGYGLSLAGVGIFIFGGAFDLVWHSLFGFEADIETLLSPAHLLLALGGTLIATGPLRSVWRRYPAGQEHGWAVLGPAIVSATLVLSVLTLFTQYAHPAVVPSAEASVSTLARSSDAPASAEANAVDGAKNHLGRRGFTVRVELESDQVQAHPVGASSGYYRAAPGLGVSSILIQTTLLMGVVLMLVRRWPLPFGALLFMLAVNGLVMIVQADEYRLLAAFLVAGVVGDLLISHLRPSAKARNRFYLFAFSLPVVLFAGYFLILDRSNGIAWSTHLWTGSIVIAGLVGLLLSFLLVSPLDGPEPVEPAV